MPQLVERDLLDVASTPILLFMIASTWDQHVATREKPTLAAIYEGFFANIAHGKHKADADKHKPIAEASKLLRDALVERGDLPDDADPPEAMLWLLSRLAWEAKRLEDAEWLSGKPKKALREYQVRKILNDELDLGDVEELEQTIYMGVLLALQADLSEGKPRILFGHKSFREFMIARYWERRLAKIAAAEKDKRRALEACLLNARLIEEDDRSIDFLIEMLQPWSESRREQLFQWAETCFNDEKPHSAEHALRDDPRPLLREAALAIGCNLFEKRGIRAKDPLTLRSMLAWFWVRSDVSSWVIAPSLISPEADLSGAFLFAAHLPGADLHASYLLRVNLTNADLSGADLSGSTLYGSTLHSAKLNGANLNNADLRSASMYTTRLNHADLRQANLSHSSLYDSSLEDADLSGAQLSEARLDGTNLRGAKLHGADLRMAYFRKAELQRADLSGTLLQGASLQRVSLEEANLRDADLRDAVLLEVNLHGADLTNAVASPKQRPQLEAAGVSPEMLDAIRWQVETDA